MHLIPKLQMVEGDFNSENLKNQIYRLILNETVKAALRQITCLKVKFYKNIKTTVLLEMKNKWYIIISYVRMS